VDVTGRRARRKAVSRDKAMATLIGAMLLVLVMARYTDCEIKRAEQAAHAAEAKAAAAVVEAGKVKERYLQKLEEACNHGN
jgi:uncharacterized protein (UPF0333 family)